MELIVQDGAGRCTALPFEGSALTVGRHTANDVCLASRNVSRRHCRFVRAAAGYFVEDLGSSTGVRVGGRRVSGFAPLAPGEPVAVGDFRLYLAEPEPVELEFAAPAPAVQIAVLRAVPSVTIGRTTERIDRARRLLHGAAVAVLLTGGIAASGAALWIGSGGSLPAEPDPADPALAHSLLERGGRLADAGQLRDAIRTLQAAVAEDANAAEAHRRLGESWALLGDGERAAAHYRRFLELSPAAPQADAIRLLLESRQGLSAR